MRWIVGMAAAAAAFAAQAGEIVVNGRALPAAERQAVEQRTGVPLQPGRWWYDARSGLWGAEGAGAAGLAALLHAPERFRGQRVGLVLCGGNIDARILASIMVRELERRERIIAFRLTGEDRPGFLGRVATRLGELGANILEVTHRRTFLSVPAKGVSLDVTVETRDAAHAEEIVRRLEAERYVIRRIDANGVLMPGR